MDNAGRQRLFGAESIKAAAVERAGQGNENSLTRSRDQIADQLAIYAGACVCRRLGHWSMRIIGCKPPVRTQLRILMTQLELEVEQQEELQQAMEERQQNEALLEEEEEKEGACRKVEAGGIGAAGRGSRCEEVK